MRCGMTLFIQGYQDWDRYLARERGEQVLPLDPNLDRTRLSEEIETALAAEDQGFDSLWTVEHHVSPYTMITNPIQLLTFFAGATKRMDMGTMVVVLPWHHPPRVAEDITMLQYALRGRTPYIGFGRGAARREFRQLGFDSALNNYELMSGHFATTKGYEHYAAMADRVNTQAMGAAYLEYHVWGTPDQCVEKLRGIADAFHPEEFMLVFRYGSMPRDVAEKSIGLFARDVLPAVHELKLQAPIDYATATR